MSEEVIDLAEYNGTIEKVKELLDPDEFDVLDYVEDQPIATDTVKIFVNLKVSRELVKLKEERDALLENRRKAMSKPGENFDLSIVDSDEDTEYDKKINELYKELEKSALIFELQSVSPKLVRSIRQHWDATAKDAEDPESHEERASADILRRAIASVRTGDGKVDKKEWTIDRLIELDKRLHAEQSAKLVGALYSIIYTGEVFEQALTADF